MLGIQTRFLILCICIVKANGQKKWARDGGELESSNDFNTQSGTKILFKRMLSLPLILITMVGMIVKPIRKWRNFSKKSP